MLLVTNYAKNYASIIEKGLLMTDWGGFGECGLVNDGMGGTVAGYCRQWLL